MMESTLTKRDAPDCNYGQDDEEILQENLLNPSDSELPELID
jgi:hypothetical protein